MDDYLTKPVEPDMLYAMIVRWTPDIPSDTVSPSEGASTPETVTPISKHPRYQITTEPVIDQRALEALRTLDTDGVFFTEVLTEFLVDSDSILNDLADASQRRDVVAFKDGAHSLRSSANHVGASRMVKMLMDLRDVRIDDLGDAGLQTIKNIRSEFAEVRTKLERELGRVRTNRSGNRS